MTPEFRGNKILCPVVTLTVIIHINMADMPDITGYARASSLASDTRYTSRCLTLLLQGGTSCAC